MNNINSNSNSLAPVKKYYWIFESPSLENKSVWYVLDLYAHIFLANMTNIYSVAFLTWYYVFIVQRFDTTLDVAAYMTVVTGVIGGIISAVIPGYVFEWQLLSKYLLLVLNSILRMSVMLVGFIWNVDDTFGDKLYWLWLAIIGFCWGVGAVVPELIVLEQQPARDTSKIAAINLTGKYFYGGIVVAIITVYWNVGTNYPIFGSVFIVCDLLAISVLLVLIILKLHYYGRKFQILRRTKKKFFLASKIIQSKRKSVC
jgi:hypothetical protein